MRITALLFSLIMLLGCSSDDNGNSNDPNNQNGDVPNTMSISLREVDFNTAIIEWTRPSAAAAGTVLYDIVLNSQTVRENYQNLEYQFFGLTPETNYNVIVTGLDSEGKETFAELVFQTPADDTPPDEIFIGDLTIGNQEAIDNFTYRIVQGRLRIRNPGITNLAGLSILEHVSGGLVIDNTSLQNLDGLEQLTSYDVANPSGGVFSIDANDQLTDISGVNNYLAVGRSITIRGNSQLTNIVGVTPNATLRSVNISGSALTNLNFLSSVNSITENLSMFDLPDLTDTNGLANLVFSGTSFSINRVPQLSNISGSFEPTLPNTKVTLGDMGQLTNIDFLNGLVEVRELTFTNLPSLTNYTGANNLQRVLDIRFRELPLQNFDDFSNLVGSPNNWETLFYAQLNPNLSDFCGLTVYMQNTTIRTDPGYEWGVFGNAYNPNESDVESPTECSI